MAIEIIGEDDGVKREATCSDCGAKLQFLPKDIQSKTYRDYTGGSDTYCWIDCPRCRKNIQVSEYPRR